MTFNSTLYLQFYLAQRDRWVRVASLGAMLLPGCEEFTCADYATCPIESEAGSSVTTGLADALTTDLLTIKSSDDTDRTVQSEAGSAVGEDDEPTTLQVTDSSTPSVDTKEERFSSDEMPAAADAGRDNDINDDASADLELPTTTVSLPDSSAAMEDALVGEYPSDAGRECLDNEVEECNDCGRRTCNSSTGKWAECQAAAENRCNATATAIEACNATGLWIEVPCQNADTVNCSVACASISDQPECVTTANDSDGDGYASAACVAAPGDDCDDTTVVVSPGSTEICDERDNDCDSFIDILDSSISLSGLATRVQRADVVSNLRRIDITWHEDEFFFVADGTSGIDYSPYTSIYTGYANTGGGVNGIGLNDDATMASNGSTELYDSARVTSVGGVLGAAVRSDGIARGALFVTLSKQGAMLTRQGGISVRGGDITHDGSSFVLATHSTPLGTSSDYTFNFVKGTLDGELTDPFVRDPTQGQVEHQNAAFSGSVTGVVYTDKSESTPSMQLMRLSSGVILGPIELDQPAQLGDITALASGEFGIAWATPEGFRVQIRGTNGSTVLCNSSDIPFGNGELDELDGVAIAESNSGILVAAVDAGGTKGRAELFVFDNSCSLRTESGKPLFDRDLGASEHHLPQLPRIAVGGGYVAFAWTVQQSDKIDEASAEEFSSYVRVVPEALCE